VEPIRSRWDPGQNAALRHRPEVIDLQFDGGAPPFAVEVALNGDAHRRIGHSRRDLAVSRASAVLQVRRSVQAMVMPSRCTRCNRIPSKVLNGTLVRK